MIDKYLIEEALIMIPVLMIFGKMIKETPNVKTWIIPYVILFLGVLLTMMLLGFNVSNLLQGILVSGASVFVYELFDKGNEGIKNGGKNYNAKN